jgi:hypothetical protein
MAKEIYTFDPETDFVASGDYTIIFQYTNDYNIVTYTAWNETKGKMETDFIPRDGSFEFTRDQKLSHKTISYKSLNTAQKFLKEQGAVVEAVQEQVVEEAAPVEAAEPYVSCLDKWLAENASDNFDYYQNQVPILQEPAKDNWLSYSDEEATPEKERAPMTTTEITIYQQGDKTYCTDCKPKGGKRGTLVLSLPDRVFCDSCGNDFYEEVTAEPQFQAGDIISVQAPCDTEPSIGIALEVEYLPQSERYMAKILFRKHPDKVPTNWAPRTYAPYYVFVGGRTKVELVERPTPPTPEPDDEELSLSDLAAIDHALAQPDMEPVTMEELAAMVEQTQKPAIGTLIRLKGSSVNRQYRITRYYSDSYHFVCEMVGEPENTDRTRVWNVDDVEVLPEPPQPEQPYSPAMGDEVIVTNGMYSGLQGTVAGQVYIDRYDKQETVIVTLPKRGQIAYNVKDLVPVKAVPPAPQASLVQQAQPETLYTVEDTRLALPVHYLSPNAISPDWYSPKQFSSIKEASDVFVAHHGKPARYVDPYQFGVLCKLRMQEWNTQESALSCGILPTERQVATFDTSLPY